jgi:xanthine/uracil/vitamin C permease (AzgA family)
MRQPASAEDPPQSGAARLFDLRLLIGGLFVLYGVVLIVSGVAAGAAAIQKASGVNINLWTGLGMLLLGLLFLLWYRLLPLTVPPAAGETPAGTDRR